jgi:hypothetical protein
MRGLHPVGSRLHRALGATKRPARHRCTDEAAPVALILSLACFCRNHADLLPHDLGETMAGQSAATRAKSSLKIAAIAAAFTTQAASSQCV